jgi:hypothetical protein
MQADADIARRAAALDEPAAERLLQATLERLLADDVVLLVGDEEDARELVAAFLTQEAPDPVDLVRADDVVPPTEPLEVYVRRALVLLATDPGTADLVASSLESLPEETQMVIEPVTAALVLGVLVAFLQTKIDIKVSRKDGKTDFSFSLSKKATTDKTMGEVLDVVRKASIG